MKPYTVALYTLGCKVSQYETEAIREVFLARGATVVPFPSPADIYVINTCTVTAESDHKCRKAIRRAHAANENAVIMVTGCYSQVAPDDCMALDGVAYVGGNGGKMKIPDAALSLLRARETQSVAPVCAVTDIDKEPFEPMQIDEAPRTRAYIKIEDGCECRCTYCAIPAARGRVRSRAPDDILREVERLVKGGTREVVLTGIETASYGADLENTRLADLLTLLEQKSHVERIRLGSLTPELFRADFVSRIASLRKLVPHFHISMQSGSDHVLNLMRRRYSRKMAEDGIRRLYDSVPRLMLTGDMIVGFPGESEEDFKETLDFVKNARFLSLHVFPYSKRKGTPAATFPQQLPEAVKRERAARLRELAAMIGRERLLETVASGDVLPVLFETYENGVAVGHSDSFIEVAVPSPRDLHGEIFPVIPRGIEGTRLLGEIQ